MMSPLGKYVEQIEKADVELSRECIDRIKHKDVTFTKERVSRTEIPMGSQESSPLSALKHGSIIVWNQMSGTWIIYSITNNLVRRKIYYAMSSKINICLLYLDTKKFPAHSTDSLDD